MVAHGDLVGAVVAQRGADPQPGDRRPETGDRRPETGIGHAIGDRIASAHISTYPRDSFRTRQAKAPANTGATQRSPTGQRRAVWGGEIDES